MPNNLAFHFKRTHISQKRSTLIKERYMHVKNSRTALNLSCQRLKIRKVISPCLKATIIQWQGKGAWQTGVNSRGIRTDAKLRSVPKIQFNVMHLVNLCKKFVQKLQFRGFGYHQISSYYLAISDIFFRILTILLKVRFT